MKLIIGLGNPGREYNNTRHNMGFIIIDEYASFHGVNISKKKFDGLYVEFSYNNEKVILLKPQKYMNLSGIVIKNYIDFFKINYKDILIISDDLDQELCKYKLKYKGSSGGHNGLKDIENHLKTNEYKRLKIGISNNKDIDTKDYVLGKFTIDENEKINVLKKEINVLLDDFVTSNFDQLMSKYNKK